MAGNSKRVADSILKKAGMKATITETVVSITRFITSTQLTIDRITNEYLAFLSDDLKAMTAIRSALKDLENWAKKNCAKFNGDIALCLTDAPNKTKYVEINDQWYKVHLAPGRTTTKLDDVKIKEFMVESGIPPAKVAAIWKDATTETAGEPYVEVRKVKGPQVDN